MEENPYESPQSAEHQLRRTPNKPSYVMGSGCVGAIVASIVCAFVAASSRPQLGLGVVALIVWIFFYLVRASTRTAVAAEGQDSTARTTSERVLVVLAFLLSMGIAFFTTCTAAFMPRLNRPNGPDFGDGTQFIAAGVAAAVTFLWLLVEKDKVE